MIEKPELGEGWEPGVSMDFLLAVTLFYLRTEQNEYKTDDDMLVVNEVTDMIKPLEVEMMPKICAHMYNILL